MLVQYGSIIMCILSMMYAEKIPTRAITVNDDEYLFFSGTSYLGLHGLPEFGNLVKQGFELYGTNYGASRLGNVSIPVFEEAENKFANWLDAPSVLLVSSGTLAGRLILESLGPEYSYHFGSNAHVAINPTYGSPHTEVFNFSIEDVHAINFSNAENHVIAFNTIDALTATIPSLNWISKLPKDKKIILLIDDSHGIGVLGREGRGLYENIKNLHPTTIMISSLGKAMGLPAGLIAGPNEYIHNARRHSLFGGSSPVIPAYLHAYLQADNIYQAARNQLQRNIHYFVNELCTARIFTFTKNFPVFCSEHTQLASYLELNKIRISQFAYPSPEDKMYTRIILNSLHTESDLEKLINLINKYVPANN